MMKNFRTFTDSAGVLWTALRVEPEAVSPTLERLRESMTRASLERRRPWLLFESRMGERRRLAPVPEAWDQPGSDHLLAAWCTMAESVPPAPERRAADAQHPEDL
jgi:hypothetical protein